MNTTPGPPTFNKMTIAIIWIALLLVTTLVFNGVIKNINNPNKQLTVTVNKSGNKEIILERNRYGHYLATGQINEQSVNFILDTGATLVAIPEHIAKKLKLKKGQSFRTKTANGTGQSYATNINKLTLGNIVMNNVPASINKGMEFDEVLLGMSFLKHLHIIQQGALLKISIPE